MQVRDSCDPGGVPDDSLRAVYQTVSSLSSALLHVSLRVSASYLYILAFAFFVILFFLFLFLLFVVFTVCVCVVCFMLSPELCRADVLLIFSCPADHVLIVLISLMADGPQRLRLPVPPTIATSGIQIIIPVTEKELQPGTRSPEKAGCTTCTTYCVSKEGSTPQEHFPF